MKNLFKSATMMAILAVFAAMTFGCNHDAVYNHEQTGVKLFLIPIIKKVPVTQTQIDTLVVNKTDTVYIERFDTIRVNQTDTIYVNNVDTLFVNKTDTLYVNVEVEVEVPVYDTVEVEKNYTGYLYGKHFVAGAQVAILPEYRFENGEHVGTEWLESNFDATIKAGDPIEVYEKPILDSKKATIERSTTNSTYIQEAFYYWYNNSDYTDNWNATLDKELIFQCSDGSTKTRTIEEDWMDMSIALYPTESGWKHMVAMTINNVIQSIDEQEFYMKPVVYALRTSHKNSRFDIDNRKIIDNHIAVLLADGEAVETQDYSAEHMVSYEQSSKIEYKTAKNVENTKMNISNGKLTIGNTIVTIDIQSSNCATVTMQTNQTTYCHPAYAVEGAVPALDCCNPSAIRIEFGSLEGTSLPATIIVSGEDELEIPVILYTDPQPTVNVYGVEFDTYATVVGANKSQLIAYPTINGKRTGETVKLTSNFSGSLMAGAQINKTSNGSVSLSNTNASISSNKASFVYTLDGSSFSDNWSWNTQASATFTYNMNGVNETVTKAIKANVIVKSTQFSGSNGTYRNTASLYADGYAIDSDVQVIVVNKPANTLIDGYTAIAAYITTCYHPENKSLINDGNHLVIVFRNNTDKSKYIVRQTNSTTSTNGTDFTFYNLDEKAVYSKVNVNGKWVPAYLSVISDKDVAVEWGYSQINGNFVLPINRMAVTTGRLADPIIEVGKVVNGAVTINGLKFK